MTQPLSSAAQAVLDAMHRSYDHEQTRRAIAAEVLRALAEQMVPEEDWPDQSIGFGDWNLATERCEQRKNTRLEILTIAAELEGER